MKRMICFDMDGTIADLYGVPDWESFLINRDTTPYRVAAPMWDIARLNDVLERLAAQDWEIRIISWLSMQGTPAYNNAVRQAKRRWLAKYSFPASKCHLVAYGTQKADCVRKYAEYAILVDDNAKVRASWDLGATIDPTATNIIDELEALLN